MKNPFDNNNPWNRGQNSGFGFPFGNSGGSGNGQNSGNSYGQNNGSYGQNNSGSYNQNNSDPYSQNNGGSYGQNNGSSSNPNGSRGPKVFREAGGTGGGKKFLRGILIGVAAFFVLFILLPSSLVVTYPNEYNVIRQFGRIVDIKEEPGLSFRTPFVSSVTSIPSNLRLYDLPASDVITSDKKSMIVDCYVLWTIRDPRKFIQTLNGSIFTAESRIDPIVYNGIKNTISDMTQDEVIQSRDGKFTVANNTSELESAMAGMEVDTSELGELMENQEPAEVEIVNLTEEIMKNYGDVEDQYGIRIETVDVKILDLPDENKAAVYERMVAERNNIAAQYTALGASEGQIIRNAADKEVSILLSEANAKADQLVAEGEAEYMRILSEAYNDTDKADFYLFVRSLDALKLSMSGDGKTIVLDDSSPIAQIFQAGPGGQTPGQPTP